MTQIITGAPIWVWSLLVVLILVGMRARHDRYAPAVLIYTMPLLGILALRSTAALPGSMWIWLVFVAAYLAGGWIGHRLQAGWILGREGRTFQLKGESLTMIVILLVFTANFVGGFLQAVAPQLYGNAAFQVGFVVLLALNAGSFAGRAVRVWQYD